MKCQHGNEIGLSQLSSGGWWGGVGHCDCCKSAFGFINSSSFGADGLISSRTMVTHLCTSCGGGVTDYIHPDYERVVLDESDGIKVTTVRKKETSK